MFGGSWVAFGSFITIPDRHNPVCSYLGLAWGPLLGWRDGVGMQFGCQCQPPTWEQPSAGHWSVGGGCDSVTGRASSC